MISVKLTDPQKFDLIEELLEDPFCRGMIGVLLHEKNKEVERSSLEANEE